MKTIAFAAALLAAIPAFAAPPAHPGTPQCSPSLTPPIVRKLNGIIIPKVDFRDVTVAEAIEFLRQRAKALDPEGTGVNIVLKLPAEPTPAPAPQKVTPPRPR
jgi:hypothetical protein